MSDRPGVRVSRRALLAAVSTVGTVGALAGVGTAAYLHDEEALGTSEMAAGAVYLHLEDGGTGGLDLEFALDDYGFDARDEETVCVGLGAESNPGWVWLRACPVGGPTDELRARVTVDGDTVFSGTLGGLLATLSGGDGGGVLLTEFAGDGAEPLDGGDAAAVCLTVGVWAPYALRDDPETVRALKDASPLTFALDVYAEQSRHVSTPRRPGPSGTNPAFAFPACDDPGDPTGHAISNVWLCTGGPVDESGVSWVVRDPSTGADVTGAVAEAFVVEVTAPVPIDYAVVKAGTEFHRFEGGGATTLTVTSSGGTQVDAPSNFATCACVGDGVKLDDWDEDAGTFTTLEAKSCGETGGTGPAKPKGPKEPKGPNQSTGNDVDSASTGNDGGGNPHDGANR
ncbi:MAG: hypothetical protein ABEJ82_08510 [Haloplanus sp.]